MDELTQVALAQMQAANNAIMLSIVSVLIDDQKLDPGALLQRLEHNNASLTKAAGPLASMAVTAFAEVLRAQVEETSGRPVSDRTLS